MIKKNITPRDLKYLLDSNLSIEERLDYYSHKIENLAFVGYIETQEPIRFWKNVVFANPQFTKTFTSKKLSCIKEIQSKLETLSYPEKLHYLFYDVKSYENIISTGIKDEHGNFKQIEVYNITPTDYEKADIIKEKSFEHIKRLKNVGRNIQIEGKDYYREYKTFNKLKSDFLKVNNDPEIEKAYYEENLDWILKQYMYRIVNQQLKAETIKQKSIDNPKSCYIEYLHFYTAKELKKYLEHLENYKNNHDFNLDLTKANKKFIPSKNSDVDHTELGWFKVGLAFAQGKIKKRTAVSEESWKEITCDAGLPITLRPYVSQTSQSNGGPKDIYINKKKMRKIYNYCIANKITMTEKFLSEYNKFKD